MGVGGYFPSPGHESRVYFVSNDESIVVNRGAVSHQGGNEPPYIATVKNLRTVH